MPAAAHKGREKVALPKALPNPDEDAALSIAATELRALCPSVHNAEAVTSAVISKWIIERSKRASRVRLSETVAFDLGDARLRGFIEAALPQIGEALGGLDPTKPLFELSRDEVVGVFAAACIGASAAATAYGESQAFPFDDPIPFGD